MNVLRVSKTTSHTLILRSNSYAMHWSNTGETLFGVCGGV